MYKTLTKDDLIKYQKLPDDYKVDAFVTYGTYGDEVYQSFKDALKRAGLKFKVTDYKDSFLFGIIKVDLVDSGMSIWFCKSYGGALLSEYAHLACLFGSKKNILLGSCGGLKSGARANDIIIPEYSFAEESSAKTYSNSNRHHPNKDLQLRIKEALTNEGLICHKGPTTTCQAMLGETREMIDSWVDQGYVGVEMEAATLFAVSNNFKVPAAAALVIADNLIEEETVLSDDFKARRLDRNKVKEKLFDMAIKELLGL